MAQIDTSIYNNLQAPKIASPFENAAMLSQIQNGQNQNRLAGMQFKEAERKDSERNALADAYRGSYNPDGTQDRNKLYQTLATGGQGQLVPGLQKQYNEADASGVELQNKKLAGRKAQVENALQTLSATEQIMRGVTDQASYEDVLPQLRALHDPETAAKIPPVFDPAAIERGRMQAMPLKDQLAQEWKQLEHKLNTDKFQYQQGNDAANRGVTMRGQNISASNAAAGRAVTVRGQDMVDNRSKQTIAQGNKPPAGYRYTKDGNLEQIPGGPADLKRQAQLEGGGTVDTVVTDLRDMYNQLGEKGGITSTKNRWGSNLVAGVQSSGTGQAAGRLFGTENQSMRNTIAQKRPLLLQAIMKATGMTAKQMDSNTELKLYLSTATDPTLDLETNKRALDMIEKLYGSGAGNAPIAPPGKATPATPAGGYSDAEKERRYQEFKARNGK